ncbi:MAG: FAD-dependent oxidoreductase [Lentisphaerae bacterium]|nr:FAD-dependent oxidoreductase [Lentisphaerota bacterium]
MVTLNIDRRPVDVPAGTTLLVAARRLGIAIPTLCFRDGLEHVTSCMLCVVEDVRTGCLHPACSTPVQDGMDIATASGTVLEARRTALELLLGDHLGDCEGPCARACAAGMNIPAMLRAIRDGDLREAIRVVKRHIALPAALGRICPAPCEKACRRGTHDAPVAICRLKRFVADADLASPDPYLPERLESSGFRVAVVGAGPAGLSAACALARDGHACTVFEKGDRPGGGLRAPELSDTLPSAVLNAEIAQIARLGMTFETGVEIGVTCSLHDLKQRFDAIILAWGASASSLLDPLGLESGPHGITANWRTHRTGDPVIFACGNAVVPGRLAVRAVAQGQAAALAVGQMLRGEAVVGTRHRYNHRLSAALTPDELAAFMTGTAPGPRTEPADHATGGYSTDEAPGEAARCLHCDCRKPEACQLRRYADDYGVNPRGWKPAHRRPVEIVRHGNTVYEPGKCIACGICVRIANAAREPLGLTFIGRGFTVRIGVPFHESLEKGLSQVAAACVEACPTGALAHDR